MMQKGKYRFLIIVLLAGYLSVTYTIIRQRHYHILKNGKIIYHAHFPVSDHHPSGKHDHDSSKTLAFNCNLLDFQVSCSLMILNPLLAYKPEIPMRFRIMAKKSTRSLITKLRAPPVG